MRKTSNRMCA